MTAARQSAGILAHRTRDGVLEVLLVHPGGPFWQNKDAGAWSIPKGEFGPGDDALAAAKREFEEETGASIDGAFVPLPLRKQKSGKTVHAWAIAAEFDVARMRSNTFEMEWPPKSGRMQSFPEVDRHAWFPVAEAQEKINAGQRAFLASLEALVKREA